MDRRPIIYDSSFPITGGSRDRRRGFDNDPTITRPRLVAHLKRSMGAQNFEQAIDLLNAWGDSLLGLGVGEEEGESEGESSAMDSRARDRRGAASLVDMFPNAKAPLKLEGGETASVRPSHRSLDHGPSELSRLFAAAPNPSARNFR